MQDYANGLREWIAATPSLRLAIILAVALFAILLILRLILKNLEKRVTAGDPHGYLSDLLETFSTTSTWFLLAVSLYVPLSYVALPDSLKATLHLLAVVMIVVQGAIWTTRFVTQFASTYTHKRAAQNSAVNSALFLIRWGVRSVVWSVALLLILENLGVNVTALIAGLGIGGIALGLASQGVVRDLLGSLSIVLDRPFVIGDFIVLDSVSGTVENIGMKATRLRSQVGEEIIVPNSDLLNGRIHNYRRMDQRSVTFGISLDYLHSAKEIMTAKELIRQVIARQKLAQFESCHFKEITENSLIIGPAYNVLSRKMSDFLDTQDAVNFGIRTDFEANGVRFGRPTQRIVLVRDNEA